MTADGLDEVELTLLRDFANGVPLHLTAAENAYSYAYMRRRRQDLMRELGVHSFGHALVVAINRNLLTEETISG